MLGAPFCFGASTYFSGHSGSPDASQTGTGSRLRGLYFTMFRYLLSISRSRQICARNAILHV